MPGQCTALVTDRSLRPGSAERTGGDQTLDLSTDTTNWSTTKSENIDTAFQNTHWLPIMIAVIV